jgi:hypothetical protein
VLTAGLLLQKVVQCSLRGYLYITADQPEKQPCFKSNMIVSFVKKCKKVFTNEEHRRIIQNVISKQLKKEDNMKYKLTEGGIRE